ncbi:MAG: type II toxin-antitoxin system VapC family toxin [Paracoccaceae bacterium]|nr:type II toxin-antitoxin system VapC family toxin [Paracoccaceae bacterium]
MIAVDTSALMAILLQEPGWDDLVRAVETAEGLCISAGTLAEAMIVAERRSIAAEMAQLIEGLGIEVVALGGSGALAVAAAYRAWGKGVHPAGLNFGDCFAYALASERSCPLLFVGEDFRQTDLRAATGQDQPAARAR